ncbi:hypothetical protein AAER26_26270 [Pseudomonas aeruginosa]
MTTKKTRYVVHKRLDGRWVRHSEHDTEREAEIAVALLNTAGIEASVRSYTR